MYKHRAQSQIKKKIKKKEGSKFYQDFKSGKRYNYKEEREARKEVWSRTEFIGLRKTIFSPIFKECNNPYIVYYI